MALGLFDVDAHRGRGSSIGCIFPPLAPCIFGTLRLLRMPGGFGGFGRDLCFFAVSGNFSLSDELIPLDLP